MELFLQSDTIEFLFQQAHIQRWNEFIRPSIGFSELDKQAHKAIIAFVLAAHEKENGNSVDELRLIEIFLFEMFERTLLTDIKPPIFRRLIDKHANKIHEWAINELEKQSAELYNEFGDKMREYFESNTNSIEKRILKAAHYLATRYELNIIASQNKEVYGFAQTQTTLELELEEHYSLIGVQKAALNQKTNSFISLLGRLRFQKRWISTPRTPETTVMGHMLITAILSFLSLKSIKNICNTRLVNGFYAGLFHDLPEVLTRDIISPIKRNVDGLDELIREVEETLIKEELMPICPNAIKERIEYYIYDEFANKITQDGKMIKLSKDDDISNYNQDRFNTIDGQVVNACDKLSAFFEAAISIKHGIKSKHLLDAVSEMKTKNANLCVQGIKFGDVYTAAF